MSVIKQDKFPLFSANIGDRIAWLRSKRGLTLSALGDGRPTTAQSWEDGKMPRRAKWAGIASRLGLSEEFIFLGKPRAPEDYEFIVKWHYEIENSADVLRGHASTTASTTASWNMPSAAHAFATDDDPDFAPPLSALKSGHSASRPDASDALQSSEVASRIPEHRRPSSREDCENYFKLYLDTAARSGDPDGFPTIMSRLKRQFSLHEWATSNTTPEPTDIT